MANQFLGLSLFILLLSFFIILNRMSNFEENKSLPVVNSLAVAFSNKGAESNNPPSVAQDTTQASYREGDTLDRLQDLFRSQITGVDVKKNRLGTVMHVRVPLKKFEKEIMKQTPELQGSVLEGAGGDFAPTLVSVLQTSNTKIPYRLDMILNVPASPAKLLNENPEEINARVKKVTAFAKRLEDSGLPKKLVSAGVGEGEEGTIDLFFRRYMPFNPLGTQEPSAEGSL